MDVTNEYLDLVKSYGGDPSNRPASNLPPQDALTKQCLEINEACDQLSQYLISVRPAYLARGRIRNTRMSKKEGSNSQTLTEKQKDGIDFQARTIIQNNMDKVEKLKKWEEDERQKRKTGRSLFVKFMADASDEGQYETIALHRQGMFWYLFDKLANVSATHSKQQEIRVSWQLEKARSTFHRLPEESPASTPTSQYFERSTQEGANPLEAQVEDPQLDQLPAEMVQQLESENNALLEELQLELNAARKAEKSLIEISELQTALAIQLSSQNDKIHSLLEDASSTHVDVSMANKQLESAKRRNRMASKIIIYTCLVMSILLLFYDAILW